MANLKIPYHMVAAVAVPQRREQMLSSIARRLPLLQRQPMDPSKVLHIACYGPSLRDTWRELRHPIISMSGATKFLADRGVVPDYHIDTDPRRNKVQTSLPPVPGVTYIVSSICCPEYFDALQAAGVDILYWHTVSTNWDDETRWVAEHDPDAVRSEANGVTRLDSRHLVLHTGQTIGLAALHIGGVLGFSRFEIHGMDGSFAADGARHAGPHAGVVHPNTHTWPAAGKVWPTSQIMANAVAETVNTVKNYPIFTVFHGEGLTQALVREARLPNSCCADEAERRAAMGQAVVQVAQLPPIGMNLSFWQSLPRFLHREDLPELVRNIATCEARRRLARYDTGTVPFESAVQLRALARYYEPQVVAEVGTFIGTSTLALHTGRVTYTCDRSNDCVPCTESIITHPHRGSTEMLAEIQEPVDLFFFDGRLQAEDLAHVLRLSTARTVYVFDDYVEGPQGKGMANVRALWPLRPGWVLMPPDPGQPSTLAVLAPVAAGMPGNGELS